MRLLGATVLFCAMISTSVSAAQPTASVLHHRVEVSAEYPQMGIEAVDEMIRVWLEEHLAETMAAFSGVAVDPDMDEESSDSIHVSYATVEATPPNDERYL